MSRRKDHTSIDDILNASDSDEDGHVDSAAVDLELLLEDDDDDNGSAPSTPLAPANTQNISSTRNSFVAANSNSISSISQPASIPHLPAKSIETVAVNDPVAIKSSVAVKSQPDVANIPPSLSSTSVPSRPTGPVSVEAPFKLSADIEQAIREMESEEDIPMGESDALAALSSADKREHRFLMAGIREVISALQSKRIRNDASKSASETGGIGSSVNNNLKCSEMDLVTAQLRKNASFRNHGPGVGTVLSIHNKFIAVGTSRGLVLLFDHEQEIRQVIGSAVGATARSTAPVSAVDINPAGTLLVCGHDSGEVALWDVLKGALLKRVTDVHTNSICRLRVLLHVGEGYPGPGAGAGIASQSDVFCVSVDSRGTVHRIKISKMLWTSYVSEAECLLDGSAGTVIDMELLSPFHHVCAIAGTSDPWQHLVGMHAGNQFIALNSLTRTLVVQLHPIIKIRYRWAVPTSASDPVTGGIRPETVGSLSWNWAHSGDITMLMSSQVGILPLTTPIVPGNLPLLARAWGETVQLLVVYPTSVGAKEEGCHCQLIAEKSFPGCNFVGVKWLSGTSIALITLTEVIIVRRNLEKSEVCSMLPALCTSMKILYESRSSMDQAIRPVTWVYQGKLYFLSPEALYKFHIQSWKELVDNLIVAGNWLDALSLALDNFKGGAESDDPVTERATIDKYIRRYVDLAISQSSSSGSKSVSKVSGLNSAGQHRNHYHLVAGVCIEYCVCSGSLSLLFNDLFQTFKAVRQEHVFLEELEPYILKREISALPQHILLAFVESSATAFRFSSLERCVLYLDLDNNDVGSLLTFLLSQGLYSGYLYAKAYQSGDFAGAFTSVFECMLSAKSTPSRRSSTASAPVPTTALNSGFPSIDQAHVGYKLLLFCKYLADRKMFPRGDSFPSSLQQVTSLLDAILIREYRPAFPVADSVSSILASEYPVALILAKVDSSGIVYCICNMLKLLCQLLRESGSSSLDSSQFGSMGDMFSALFQFTLVADQALNSADHLRRLFFSNSLELVVSSTSALSVGLLAAVVSHCASEIRSRKEAEEMVHGMVSRQSKYANILSDLREILVRHSFWKALLGMHDRRNHICSKAEFDKALRVYCSLRSSPAPSAIGIAGKPGFQEIVFDYISAQFVAYQADCGVSNSSGDDGSSHAGIGENTQADARTILCKYLVEMHNINEARTQGIACTYLMANVGDVISSTMKNPHVQYSVLKAMFQEAKNDTERELVEIFTPSEVLTFIRLLLAFNAEEAYTFITTTEHYPLDETLALCKEKDVLDASAYLLERAGDALGALVLLHTDITKQIQAAKAEIDTLLRADTIIAGRRASLTGATPALGATTGPVTAAAAKSEANRVILQQILAADKQGPLRAELAAKLTCYSKLLHATTCAANICSRHSSKLDTAMWFDTFDYLLKERQNTRVSKSSTGEVVTVLVGLMLHEFMTYMQAMIPPQDIIRRVAMQHGQGTGSRFSEFKDVMVSMVETYANDLFLNELLRNMFVSDLFALHKKKYLTSRMGERLEKKSDVTTKPTESSTTDASTDGNKDASSLRLAKTRRRRNNKTSLGNVQRMRDILRTSRDQESQYSVQLPLCPPAHFEASFFEGEGRKPGSLPKTAQFKAVCTM